MFNDFESMIIKMNENSDVFGIGVLFCFVMFILFSFIDYSAALYMKVVQAYRFRNLRKKVREYIHLYNFLPFPDDDDEVDLLRKRMIDEILFEYGYEYDYWEGKYIKKDGFIHKLIDFAKSYKNKAKID